MSTSESRKAKKRIDAENIDEKIGALSAEEIDALATLFTLLDRWDREHAKDM